MTSSDLAETICKAVREAVLQNAENLCSSAIRSLVITVKLNANGGWRVVLLNPTFELERNGSGEKV